jgi:hypothetical protein
MKTKRFGKKLVLNKKTIAHLENVRMNAVKGGIQVCITIPVIRTCHTYSAIVCC